MKPLLPETRIRLKKGAAWRPKSVIDHIVIRSALGKSLYYLCPSCGIPLSREYMRFCDSCGQKLGWAAVAEAEQLYERSLEEAWSAE